MRLELSMYERQDPGITYKQVTTQDIRGLQDSIKESIMEVTARQERDAKTIADAQSCGVSTEILAPAAAIIKEAMERHRLADGAQQRDEAGSSHLHRLLAPVQSGVDVVQVSVTSFMTAKIEKRLPHSTAPRFEPALFRMTETYTFADLVTDARNYWRIPEAKERLRCWSSVTGETFQPDELVRETSSKLPAEFKTIELRSLDKTTVQVEALAEREAASYEQYQAMQAKEHVTAEERALLLESILHERLDKRWTRRMLFRASLHLVFTILLTIMLCLEPTRGYYTAEAVRESLIGIFSGSAANARLQESDTALYAMNNATRFYTGVDRDLTDYCSDYVFNLTMSRCARGPPELFSLQEEVAGVMASVHTGTGDPGNWVDLDGATFTTAPPYLGRLSTTDHESFQAFNDFLSLSRVQDRAQIRMYLEYYLMSVLAPECNYGGGAIDYCNATNVTGTIALTNNLINPLRLMQRRSDKVNCSTSVGNKKLAAENGADPTDDRFASSTVGALKTGLEDINALFAGMGGLKRWNSPETPSCRSSGSTTTYGNGGPGFTYTTEADSNQEEVCGISSARNVCVGPDGFIRDIWAASDYRNGLEELARWDWNDDGTDAVLVRLQTFNAQSGCFVFADILFGIFESGVVRSALRIRSACSHNEIWQRREGHTIWRTYDLPGYYVFIYVLMGIYTLFLAFNILIALRTYYKRFHDEVHDSGLDAATMTSDVIETEAQTTARLTHQYTDVCQLCLFVCVFVALAAHNTQVNELMSRKGSFENQEFIDLSPMADSDLLLRGFLSLSLMSSIIRLFGFLETFHTFRTRFGALWNAMPNAVALVVFMLHLTLAIVVLGMLLYGHMVRSFMQVGSAMLDILFLYVGNIESFAKVINMLSHKDLVYRLTGLLLSFICVVIFTFVTSSLVVAILGEAWSDATMTLAREKSRKKELRKLEELRKDIGSTHLMHALEKISDEELTLLTRDAQAATQSENKANGGLAAKLKTLRARYSQKSKPRDPKAKHGHEDGFVPVNLLSKDGFDLDARASHDKVTTIADSLEELFEYRYWSERKRYADAEEAADEVSASSIALLDQEASRLSRAASSSDLSRARSAKRKQAQRDTKRRPPRKLVSAEHVDKFMRLESRVEENVVTAIENGIVSSSRYIFGPAATRMGSPSGVTGAVGHDEDG
eukprot:CAMPEP_0115845880 /NCGR_PEP_ID=MMETSP0287-20121206/9580_1 /TAXON_ID=412157 /ORGANISM="Chrysochromulina rotalis, Strain UIO044" /LENGTH=1175 /DNA_ID=CAMNT_0003299667 /DNA_START=138 /DNA_END=3665 /DNA_ORIENTATION=-